MRLPHAVFVYWSSFVLSFFKFHFLKLRSLVWATYVSFKRSRQRNGQPSSTNLHTFQMWRYSQRILVTYVMNGCIFGLPLAKPIFRFTAFLQSQSRPPFSIHRVFTESSQAPFSDLQDFYRVKPGPFFRFTGLLQSQARPPFWIYRVSTESSKAPLFRFTGLLQSQAGPPFSIYRVFTLSK